MQREIQAELANFNQLPPIHNSSAVASMTVPVLSSVTSSPISVTPVPPIPQVQSLVSSTSSILGMLSGASGQSAASFIPPAESHVPVRSTTAVGPIPVTLAPPISSTLNTNPSVSTPTVTDTAEKESSSISTLGSHS